MSEQTTNRRPIETLTPGDHYSNNDGVHEVVHTFTRQYDSTRREVMLTLNPLGPGRPWLLHFPEGTPVAVASPEEIREYKDLGRQQALADALRQLADDIVQQRLPITTSWFSFGPGVLDSRADLDRWAAYFGADVKMGGSAGDIPVANADRLIGERLRLDFHAQCSPEPIVLQPVVGADLAAKVQAEASTLPIEPEHYHAAGAGGEPGACSAVCACGVTFAGFDSIAEAVVELDKHIANPEPEPEQEHLFTFAEGQTYAGRFARLFGTKEATEARMKRVFGHAWDEQYDWRSFDQAGLLAKLTELPESEWPAHADVQPLQVDHAIAAAKALEPKPTGKTAECGCVIEYSPIEDKERVSHDPGCQDWWFTFGSGHVHPESPSINAEGGVSLADRYVVIRGTYETARATMLRFFGRMWCDQYGSAQRAGVDQFNLTELHRRHWPTPADATQQAGE